MIEYQHKRFRIPLYHPVDKPTLFAPWTSCSSSYAAAWPPPPPRYPDPVWASASASGWRSLSPSACRGREGSSRPPPVSVPPLGLSRLASSSSFSSFPGSRWTWTGPLLFSPGIKVIRNQTRMDGNTRVANQDSERIRTHSVAGSGSGSMF